MIRLRLLTGGKIDSESQLIEFGHTQVIFTKPQIKRNGDLAVNIAERVRFLSSQPDIRIPFDLQGLVEKTRWMLRNSLDSLVRLDTATARQVCTGDDEVDNINREMYDLVKDAIRARPEHLDALIPYLSVSRYLERIADHATNIAEDVIYLVEGVIARHRPEKYLSEGKR